MCSSTRKRTTPITADDGKRPSTTKETEGARCQSHLDAAFGRTHFLWQLWPNPSKPPWVRGRRRGGAAQENQDKGEQLEHNTREKNTSSFLCLFSSRTVGPRSHSPHPSAYPLLLPPRPPIPSALLALSPAFTPSLPTSCHRGRYTTDARCN